MSAEKHTHLNSHSYFKKDSLLYFKKLPIRRNSYNALKGARSTEKRDYSICRILSLSASVSATLLFIFGILDISIGSFSCLNVSSNLFLLSIPLGIASLPLQKRKKWSITIVIIFVMVILLLLLSYYILMIYMGTRLFKAVIEFMNIVG